MYWGYIYNYMTQDNREYKPYQLAIVIVVLAIHASILVVVMRGGGNSGCRGVRTYRGTWWKFSCLLTSAFSNPAHCGRSTHPAQFAGQLLPVVNGDDMTMKTMTLVQYNFIYTIGYKGYRLYNMEMSAKKSSTITNVWIRHR
ncbi:hypothetical protein BKA83DRAFT_4123621 [Pisolithus microcarpus]|nr:hypothetical protein BKA83DRAFT_4123621 [Pisolithus microcarpus]